MYADQGMKIFPDILKRQAMESINGTTQRIEQLMFCSDLHIDC